MPRTGVAYDDVMKVIQKLEASRITPSIRLIREQLGTGSLTTIADHKRAFEAERADGPGPALPDPITESLIKGAQAYWQELTEAAEAELERCRATEKQSRKELEDRLADAERTAADLRDAVSARDADIAELRAALKESADALQASKSELHTKDIAVARLEESTARLKDDVLKLETASARREDALSEARTEQAHWQERAERSTEEIARRAAQWEQEAAGAAGERETWKRELESVNAQLAFTIAKEARAAVERDTALQNLQEHKETVRELRDLNVQLQRNAERLQAKLDAADAQSRKSDQAWQSRLEEKDARIRDLSRRLDPPIRKPQRKVVESGRG